MTIELEKLPHIESIEIISVSHDEIDIQLKVANIEYVSSVFGMPCEIEIKLKRDIFIDPLTGDLFPVSNSKAIFNLKKTLPRLFSEQEKVQEAIDKTIDVSLIVSNGNIIAFLVLGISLKAIWSTLLTL